jgi:hypothetical protein
MALETDGQVEVLIMFLLLTRPAWAELLLLVRGVVRAVGG